MVRVIFQPERAYLNMSTAPHSGLLPLNLLPDSSSLTSSAQKLKLFQIPYSRIKSRAAASTTYLSSKPAFESKHGAPLGNFFTIDERHVLGQAGEIGTDWSLLKLCDEVSDCRQIHATVIKLSALEKDGFLENKLVVMYSRTEGLLEDALKVFEGMSERRIQTYAAMIGSCCRLEKWEELFWVFGLMIGDGMWPDKYMVPTLLKACAAKEMLLCGKMVHGSVIRRGMECDVYVGNALIHFYANCRDLASSRSVFDAMGDRDVVSWTALVVAYADAGMMDEAVEVFRSMQASGVMPDLVSWNALAAGFAKNGEVDVALQTFEEMQENGLTPKVNSWNGVISGCVHSEYYEEALEVFRAMLQIRVDPNVVTIVSLLQTCAGLNNLNLGRMLHAHALRRMLSPHAFFEGSLIDMYSKCGKVDYAKRVFDTIDSKNTAMWNEIISAEVNEGRMKEAFKILKQIKTDNIKPDVITFNTLLAGCARTGQKKEALEVLSEMGKMDLKPNIVSCNSLISGFQQCGLGLEALKLVWAMQSPDNCLLPDSMTIQPNTTTITSALAACADLNLQQKGKELHGYILRHAFEESIFISSALVDMYLKSSNVDSAMTAFERVQHKNTVLWNVLIAGLIRNKQPEEALQNFANMLAQGHEPSSITFLTVLPACADLAAMSVGKELHSYILKRKFDDSTTVIASALIKMYAKCGCIMDSRKVFDLGGDKDVALWNSMLSAYSDNGFSKEAKALFEDMEAVGAFPDHITFVSLLSACARDNLVQEGWRYFRLMEKYGIIPSIEHYTCMVAILGTAGLLEEAIHFTRQMPFEADACLWSTVLQACKLHSNPEIGETAAKALFELEPDNASSYILLANIYISSGLWDAAQNIRSIIRGRKLLTVKECSSVNVGRITHMITAGNISDYRLEETLDTWNTLATKMEENGYYPNDPVLEGEQEVDPFSCLHTEKLAICFGIVNSASRHRTIRVSKNIRMCIDCHTSAKLISKIECRELIVRDANFCHRFKDGQCSCQDRW